MIKVTKEISEQNEKLYEKRKREILEKRDELVIKGTTYYVSNDGDDANDGKTPETAWKTLNRVTDAELLQNDGVRFKRGDLFRGRVQAKAGVTYAAYGVGEKPKFYGGDRDMADSALWECYDAQRNIWKYKDKVLDPGTLVFDHGEAHSRKLIPSYIGGRFVCREDESRLFDVKNEMTCDLDLYWHYEETFKTNPSKGEDFPIPEVVGTCGDVYLRCDSGNPGEVFASIESVARVPAIFAVGETPNVTIDNLCMKYSCFAVSAGGHSVGLHVTNCEIGWIGGNIQHYYGTDPNYPQGRRGTVTRFGNGVEIYGGCEDYVVSNCYVYEVYDAAMSHQVTTSNKVTMTNIRYTDNLIEKCVYGIEYFLDQIEGERESYMDGVVMSGNIIRLGGYGWGQQRHNTDTPALIKGWSYVNTARNYTISNNIFDRCAYRMLHLVAEKNESCPEMHDNTYIQHSGGMIGQYGGNENAEPEIQIFDANAEEKINNVFGDKNAKVYYIE